MHESDLTEIPDDTIRCALSFSKFYGGMRWVPLMQSMDVETMKEVLACCVTEFQLDLLKTSFFVIIHLFILSHISGRDNVCIFSSFSHGAINPENPTCQKFIVGQSIKTNFKCSIQFPTGVGAAVEGE